MSRKKLYELTPEHRARLPEWRDRWIETICSTQAMTEEERAGCRDAVAGLYAAAKLPPPKHVVFVPSPIVLAAAGGFAAAIWELRKRGITGRVTGPAICSATRDATEVATSDATRDATWAATKVATLADTWHATWAATADAIWYVVRDATMLATEAATIAAARAATESTARDATWDATLAATRDATEVATRAATEDATRDATVDATKNATRDATRAATTDAMMASLVEVASTATRNTIWADTMAATATASMRVTVDAAADATWAVTRDATRDATEDATTAATRTATADATARAITAATEATTMVATRDATEAATEAATSNATADAARDATRDATWAATADATMSATMAATMDATRDATEDATLVATEDATKAATRGATKAATEVATEVATRDATRDATLAATAGATLDATRAATARATLDATRNATTAATYIIGDTAEAVSDTWYSNVSPVIASLARVIGGEHATMLLACAERIGSGSCWNGGNQWGQWVSYLTFFRYVAQINIDYSKFAHYEYLAEHSGPRVMTPDFCMISDRPEVLLRDEQNRPHCDDGPFCRWRDGFSLYAIHGVRVPEWLVMQPTKLTVERIHAEENEEVRRVMIERYGVARYVRDAQFEVVDADVDPLGQPRRLLRRDTTLVVELVNSTVDADGTRRVYHIPVEPELRPLLPDGQLGRPQKMTVLNAVASTFGMSGAEYSLEVET